MNDAHSLGSLWGLLNPQPSCTQNTSSTSSLAPDGAMNAASSENQVLSLLQLSASPQASRQIHRVITPLLAPPLSGVRGGGIPVPVSGKRRGRAKHMFRKQTLWSSGQGIKGRSERLWEPSRKIETEPFGTPLNAMPRLLFILHIQGTHSWVRNKGVVWSNIWSWKVLQETIRARRNHPPSSRGGLTAPFATPPRSFHFLLLKTSFYPPPGLLCPHESHLPAGLAASCRQFYALGTSLTSTWDSHWYHTCHLPHCLISNLCYFERDSGQVRWW